jgi:hypothetical protein
MDESREVLRGLLNNPDLAGIPVLVFANKQALGRTTPRTPHSRARPPPSFPSHSHSACVAASDVLAAVAGRVSQDAPGAVTPHEVQARFDLQLAMHDGSSQPMHVLGCTSLSGEVRATTCLT